MSRRSSSVDVPVAFVQGAHLVLVDGERRAFLLVLRIFQRDHQAAAAARQARIQLARHSAVRMSGGKRDQRGAVETRRRNRRARRHRARRRRRRISSIGAGDVMHAVTAIRGCRASGRARRRTASTAICDSSTPSTRWPRAASHGMSSVLPASGTNTRLPRGQRQRSPILPQQRRHFGPGGSRCGLRASAVARNRLPSLPSYRCRSAPGRDRVSSCRRSAFRRDRFDEGQSRLRGAPTAIHSTASPSTFCQPRGNNPPRLAARCRRSRRDP